MSDVLDDARLLVERSNEQIDELEILLRAFLDTEAWTTKVNLDPESRTYTHKIIIAGQPGRRTKAVAREAWGGLRAALDHLNAACARLGGSPGRDSGAHFPFVKNGTNLAKEMRRKCRHVPQTVQNYFAGLRPYPGGDDRLYALASIRNSNEHWKLRAAILTVTAIQITWPRPVWKQEIVHIPAQPHPVYELELFTSGSPAQDYHLEILANVSFEDFGAFRGVGCVNALQIQSRKVTRIIDDTEAILRAERFIR